MRIEFYSNHITFHSIVFFLVFSISLLVWFVQYTKLTFVVKHLHSDSDSDLWNWRLINRKFEPEKTLTPATDKYVVDN